MGRSISFFTDYHQDENRITNYCGVMFKLLYIENQDLFEQAIINLTEGAEISVNPVFIQQEKQENSIPDLRISLNSFDIMFETKISDWFYNEQLEKHMSALKGDTKILFMLCNENIINFDIRFKELRIIAKKKNILLKQITFEKLLEVLSFDVQEVSSNYLLYINEFKEYINARNLLPTWKYQMDVTPCGRTLNEINLGAYICPDIGDKYKHQRSRFFGAYMDKKVFQISKIDALVSAHYDEISSSYQIKISWKNSTNEDNSIIERAKEIINNCEDWRKKQVKDMGVKIILLSEPYKTSFIKDSYGGLRLRTYFNIPNRKDYTPKELAGILKNKYWSEWNERDIWK